MVIPGNVLHKGILNMSKTTPLLIDISQTMKAPRRKAMDRIGRPVKNSHETIVYGAR